MLVAFKKHHDPAVVELNEQVSVRTAIPQENHPALRSGFAGYPLNPRWNVAKYRAWKVGKQLRDDWERGVMVVRTGDCLLVPTAEPDEEAEDKPPSSLFSPAYSHNLLEPMLAQGLIAN
jgi:hypothetical protein